MSTDPETILDHVTTALTAACCAGERYRGLVPSMLDAQSGELLREVPDPLPGQRPQDRAPDGANLLYDTELLGTMYGLGDLRDRPGSSTGPTGISTRSPSCVPTPPRGCSRGASTRTGT